MTPTNELETVLRYAYLHGLTSEQWIEPTKECLESRNNLDSELCDLLLTSIFSFTQLSDPVLESYITLATTGRTTLTSIDSNVIIDTNNNSNATNATASTTQDFLKDAIISPTTFLSRLISFGESTTTRHPHQWSFLLKILPILLFSSFNSDTIISDLQNPENDKKSNNSSDWVDIMSHLFQTLSQLIAVSLYPDYYSKSTSPITTPATSALTSAISFHNGNTQTGFDSQFSYQSQTSMGYDADTALDIDNTQHIEEEDDRENKSGQVSGNEYKKDTDMMDALSLEANSNHVDHDPKKRKDKKILEVENAALAAQLMVFLIEKKGIKRVFEVRNNQRRQQVGLESNVLDYEPWPQCHDKLDPKDSFIKSHLSATASQNIHIQKLLLLIRRLTDRDLERRMAVHMKYHELEDEGTARAMPSAGLMGFLYHLVQIRPSLDDDYVVDHLLKLQTIKGSFDESFYLELWITALTGLREASLNTSCQGSLPDSDTTETVESKKTKNQNCNSVVATNRLLWKSLVLVKLPILIDKLQKKKEQHGDVGMNAKLNNDEATPLESSLKELKAFTGLINACSPSACCSEFYAPDSTSSHIIDEIMAFGKEDKEVVIDEDEDMMNSDINYNSNTTTAAANNLSTPLAIKSICSISKSDIFTSIVRVCERYGFLRPFIATELLKKKSSSHGDGMELDINEDAKRIKTTNTIDQNIDMRIEDLKSTISFSALIELLHIGLVSPLHLQKIIDFILELLREKTSVNDFYALSKICDALTECPCSVDLILQLYTPLELLGPLETICNTWNPADYNGMDIDDESTNKKSDSADIELNGVQLLYSKFGKIWNLTVTVIRRFKLHRNMSKVFADQHGFVYKFFTQGLIIYGIDTDTDDDTAMESFINNWISGLAGSGPSEDLLRSSQPQTLLLVVPTLIQRSILFYAHKQMEETAFTNILACFSKPFLDFTLSGILLQLCEELLSGQSAIALTCLRQLIMSPNTALPQKISLHPVLGSLESLLEFKRQESAFLSHQPNTTKDQQTHSHSHNTELAKGMLELTQFIHANNRMDKLTEDHSTLHTETVTTGVTPNTLFEKAELMFKYIVKSGRSMFMNDVDADPNLLWENSETWKMQVVSHYLDMCLFETALEIGGGHWFVSMIVDQVLEAGKSGGAVRAAELGSCLITTPLLYSSNRHNSCVNLLQCLLQDVLPCSLVKCAEQHMSFFQGQTLGVFTSDCLVLMKDRHEFVQKLGKWFFEALVVDESKDRRGQHKVESKEQQKDGTRFAEWNDMVIKSSVWRGFVKGLMSNPMIEEMWPNAFI